MSNFNEQRINGDMSVRNDIIVGGNGKVNASLTVERDLRVKGKLIGGFCQSKDMGLYPTEAALKAAIPSPESGMYAQVLITPTAPSTTFSAKVYWVSKVNNVNSWVDSGTTTKLETDDTKLQGIYDTFMKPQVESALEDLEEDLTDEIDALKANKATVVDLADVISCACTDAQNTGICDHCKLPTLKATFIYSVDSNTVLIPHMRTIKVTGKRGYADGYYLAFCVYHNTNSDPKALLYLLFSVATKKLIGQYHTDLNEEVPEWVLYAFHEVNGIGAGGYIVDINDDGVATDLLGRKWQMQKWQETVLDPVITIEDVTGNTISGATGAIKRISIDYDRASEKKYKIEFVSGNNSSVAVLEKAYTEPITFAGDGKYKITAWSKTNGKESVRITKEFTVSKLEITSLRVYDKPVISSFAYAAISANGTGNNTYISPAITVEQSYTEYYTDQTSLRKTITPTGTALSLAFYVTEKKERLDKHTDFLSNGKVICLAAPSYSDEIVAKIKVIVKANNKESEATADVKQSGKTRYIYLGSSQSADAVAPTSDDGWTSWGKISSPYTKTFAAAKLVWIAVPNSKTLKITDSTNVDITGTFTPNAITVDGETYRVYYRKTTLGITDTLKFEF